MRPPVAPDVRFTSGRSEGSEGGLLLDQVAGLVGSVVLPVLGAVPDGMMCASKRVGV